MQIPRSEELRRVEFVNALLAGVTGDDLLLAQQIKDAIAFSLLELEQRVLAGNEDAVKYDLAFNAAAAELMERLLGNDKERGFFHWNAMRTMTSAMPLFARTELLEGVKKLAQYRQATVLITNLRHAFLPKNQRETAQGKKEYQAALNYVRELMVMRLSGKTELRMLFL